MHIKKGPFPSEAYANGFVEGVCYVDIAVRIAVVNGPRLEADGWYVDVEDVRKPGEWDVVIRYKDGDNAGEVTKRVFGNTADDAEAVALDEAADDTPWDEVVDVTVKQ